MSVKKKALWKDIVKEIGQSKARFLSIFSIILLGVAFYAGITATSPDMVDTADHYYKDQQLMDIKVQSTMGLTEDDLDILADLEDATVETRYTQDVVLAQSSLVTKLMSIPLDEKNPLNQPYLVSGRLPEHSGEITLDSKNDYQEAYKVGDTIEIETLDEEEGTNNLKKTSFKVVGFTASPEYIETISRGNTTVGNGTLDGFAFIPETDFDMDVYTEADLRFSNVTQQTAYSPEYEKAIEAKTDKIEKALEKRPEERKKDIQDEIQKEIDKGKEEIASAKKALEDGEQELADAKEELDNGWAAYQENKAQMDQKIADAQATLDQKRQELKEAETTLANKKADLKQAQAELDEKKAQFEQKKEEGKAQLNNSKNYLEQAQAAIIYPKDQVAQETQQSLSSTAEQIDPELAGVLTGYFAGKVPASAAKQALDGFEASLAELPEEQKESAQVFLQSAREAVQSPGEQIAADQQQTLIQQGKQIDKSLGDAFAGYFAGEVPPVNMAAALDQTAAGLSSGEGQLSEAEAQLKAGQQQIDDGRAQIKKAENQLAAGKEQIATGQQELDEQKASGEAELAKAKAKLEDGQADYEAGLEEFKEKQAEGEEKIADGEADIAEAEKQLKDVPLPEYFVLDRTDNPGYAEYNDNAERIAAISKIFPIFFFLIAALVSLTTMTRMVDEQRTQMGTLKALGYSNWDIAKKFVVYSMLASLLGASIGLAIGFYLFPTVIFNAYGAMYHLPEVRISYPIPAILISYLVAFLCTGVAAFAAVRVSLKSNAATLMRPKAPKIGKRIFLERLTLIWERMSFTQKVTARNLFRYKQRMLMTISGVAGCTALILTGLGLSDSIEDVASLQYGKLHQYQAIVALDDSASENNEEKYQQLIEETTEVSDALMVDQENDTVNQKGVNQQEVNLFIPQDPERINQFILLNDRETGKQFKLDDTGAIITEKLAKLYDLKEGDTLEITNNDQENFTVKVNNIAENYLGHDVYLSPTYYEKVTNEKPDYTMQLLKYSESEEWEKTFGTALTDQKSVAGVSFVSTFSDSFQSTLDSLDIVTIILVVSAALLAFVVLYNLTNINVSERVRELSTIKVLGFYDNEVTMYIYRENLLLTFMGIIVGLLLGFILHGFVLQTVEIDQMMFSPIISISSYIYAAILTTIFSTIVMIAMHIKLKHINMLEALKTID